MVFSTTTRKFLINFLLIRPIMFSQLFSINSAVPSRETKTKCKRRFSTFFALKHSSGDEKTEWSMFQFFNFQSLNSRTVQSQKSNSEFSISQVEIATKMAHTIKTGKSPLGLSIGMVQFMFSRAAAHYFISIFLVVEG